MRRLSSDTHEVGPIKGLVIGHVQSGKTANMEALMAMAADHGWNMRRRFFEFIYNTTVEQSAVVFLRLGRDDRIEVFNGDKAALRTLTAEEQAIILDFCYTESPTPVRELEEKYAITKSSIYRRRDNALKKLKKILGMPKNYESPQMYHPDDSLAPG